MLSERNRKKWQNLAKDRGLEGRCTWCKRFYKQKLPSGMFAMCNDCGTGDVVAISDGTPMNAPTDPDRAPWPAKGTWLYDLFCEERDD